MAASKMKKDSGATPESVIRFILCARRKREDTQERYFYEWGNIHVSLMMTTPQVMEVFQRYSQHYSVSGIDGEKLIFPFSKMEWDNMADHWLLTYQDFLRSLHAEDYVQRMQPHRFGDHAFQLALLKGRTVFQKKGFRTGGGIKLVHWLKAKPGVTLDTFNRQWTGPYASALAAGATAKGLLRKYVQSTQLEVDPTAFAGSLFAAGGVSEFAGVEEFWFDDAAKLLAFCTDADTREIIARNGDAIIDRGPSFSMVTTERVLYDYVTPGEISPEPTILNPDSMEARAVAQGFRDWNKPKPPADA